MLFGLSTMAFISTKIFSIFTQWWVGKWFKNTFITFRQYHYILIYMLILIALSTSSIFKAYLHGLFSAKSSFRIYMQLLNNLVRKPMSFFDTTPTGVIINRSIGDLEIVDLLFAKRFYLFYGMLIQVFSAYFVILFISPLLLIIIILCIILQVVVLRRYLRVSNDLKRITRVSRSPVLSSISEMVNGMTQVRLYNFEENMLGRWQVHQDITISSEIHQNFSLVYLMSWVHTSFLFLITVTGFFIVWRKQRG